MRTLVIGLDCAAPEILFTHPGLKNLRELMGRGCYGRLESVIPPITVPAWMCMSTSQDPGSLGVYGFRNRMDFSYSRLGVVNSASFTAPAIWDVLGSRGQGDDAQDRGGALHRPEPSTSWRGTDQRAAAVTAAAGSAPPA